MAPRDTSHGQQEPLLGSWRNRPRRAEPQPRLLHEALLTPFMRPLVRRLPSSAHPLGTRYHGRCCARDQAQPSLSFKNKQERRHTRQALLEGDCPRPPAALQVPRTRPGTWEAPGRRCLSTRCLPAPGVRTEPAGATVSQAASNPKSLAM